MKNVVRQNAIRPSGAPIDIVKDLGLDHMQRVYERRVQAVASPSIYNRERGEAWTKLTDAVAKAYKETDENQELLDSGISTIQRQTLAVNAAKMAYATQTAILESEFPSGSQAIALEASAFGKFPGLGTAPRKRAAPKRAAAAPVVVMVPAAPKAPRKRATAKKK